MEMESCVPPGFRFHPTEEELVGYYLNRKVNSLKIDLDVITDIDLYRMEPWDIEGRCRLGYEEQNEWYFFSHKDRKYPTGTRTNRATSTGFWKATGRDKAVLSKDRIIGMRKTLVFYKGRAPNGRKTDWIMHEYRIQTTEHGPPQEEGWVVCRAFKKPNPSNKPGLEAWNNTYYLREASHCRPPSYPSSSNTSMMPCFDPSVLNTGTSFHQPLPSETFKSSFDLPNLDSPSISTSFATNETNFEFSALANEDAEDEKSNFSNQFSEWGSFDNLLASSSYAYATSMPFVSNDNELDTQNHLSQVLECFPDS